MPLKYFFKHWRSFDTVSIKKGPSACPNKQSDVITAIIIVHSSCVLFHFNRIQRLFRERQPKWPKWRINKSTVYQIICRGSCISILCFRKKHSLPCASRMPQYMQRKRGPDIFLTIWLQPQRGPKFGHAICCQIWNRDFVAQPAVSLLCNCSLLY